MSKSRVLIVDDDELILAMLGFSFDLLLPGSQVCTASDGPVALEALHRQSFDLILTDYDLPHLNGLEVARSAQRLSPSTRIILMTGAFFREGLPAGAHGVLNGVLHKPFTLRQLGKLLQENAILE